MKKFVLVLLALLVAALVSIYLFIPKNIQVTKIIAVNCTSTASTRFFMDIKKWHYWWPSPDSAMNSLAGELGFFYKNAHHTPTQAMFNGYQLQTTYRGEQLTGEIIYAQLGYDSVAFFWKYNFISSNNPVQRLHDYLTLKALKENITEISTHFKSFLENQEKVYGMLIKRSTVTDTLLVSTKSILSKYPDNEQVYTMIDQLQRYAKEKGAKQTGYPMLNVTELDSQHFQTMVALPIDIQIQENARFSWKKMVAGKILVGEVKGGTERAKEAFDEMHNYVIDYHLTSPAIPFLSLVTDRRMEKDSSKWITRIYYPIL